MVEQWRNPFERYQQAETSTREKGEPKASEMSHQARPETRNLMNETVAGERQWGLHDEEDDDVDTDEEELAVKDLSWIVVPDDEELVDTKVHSTLPGASMCRTL